jgi:hypothetical protein
VDDFTILSQQDFLDTARTITGVLTIFLGGIAAISLLVGGRHQICCWSRSPNAYADRVAQGIEAASWISWCGF